MRNLDRIFRSTRLPSWSAPLFTAGSWGLYYLKKAFSYGKSVALNKLEPIKFRAFTTIGILLLAFKGRATIRPSQNAQTSNSLSEFLNHRREQERQEELERFRERALIPYERRAFSNGPTGNNFIGSQPHAVTTGPMLTNTPQTLTM